MTYKYFVSYHYTDGTVDGFDNAIIIFASSSIFGLLLYYSILLRMNINEMSYIKNAAIERIAPKFNKIKKQ